MLTALLSFNSAQAKTSSVPVILVVGDSLSANYGITYEEGWVHLLKSKLENSSYDYKIINAKRGEIIATDTIKRNMEVTDEWNDGIPEANIVYNPQELPTESELLERVTAEVVRDLALVVLKPFQSLQSNYFDEGEVLRERRRYEEAIEKYIDAIYDERLKGIESPISKKSMEVIDQLIRKL